MTSTIQQLSQLISVSVAQLIEITSKNSQQLPELNGKLSPESEAFRQDPGAAKAASVIAAAAIQLAAAMLLRFYGTPGMHVNDIASKTGVDGTKLARLLRSLANRHIFREVEPDFFTNNRISEALDTGKSIDEILRNPESKYDGTSGYVALVESGVTTSHKASSYLYENMTDPVTAFSEAPNHAPIQRALRTDKSLFLWMLEPEQALERHTFGLAMKGSAGLVPPNLLLELFDWGNLPQGSTVVDVGGGIGGSCHSILKVHSGLRFVVQDLPAVAEDGRKHCSLENPDALTSGQITFQGHDFFTPQPPSDVSVFLMKNVIHNWSDSNASTILTHLRNAAHSNTVLLICDAVMTYSCREPTPDGAEDYTVFNDPSLVAPDLLSTGLNSVNDAVWLLDTAMHLLVNTQERTIVQFKQLLSTCGWKIVKVIRKGSSLDSVQAVPV